MVRLTAQTLLSWCGCGSRSADIKVTSDILVHTRTHTHIELLSHPPTIDERPSTAADSSPPRHVNPTVVASGLDITGFGDLYWMHNNPIILFGQKMNQEIPYHFLYCPTNS